MSTNTARPKWWQVYLTFPLLIALFMLDSRLKLSERGHMAVQIGIILIVYGLIHLWLKANARALSNMDQRQFNRTVIVTRIPLHQLPEPKTENRPMFQFRNSEIKGTLSDTFEMDYIDAEFLPMDEAAENLKKE
jgi:hypothetical protein